METIAMSRDERKRLTVMTQVREANLTLKQASVVLGLSYRQTKRLWSRFVEQGDGGLIHRSRGRPSNRQAKPGLREKVLQLYSEKYADHGPTLAAECLANDDGIVVPTTTLARWLSQAGLWSRVRRRKQHRRRRPRRQRFGELVQMDGSHHDWFEGRRDEAVLMVAIDDATGRVLARFSEEETLDAALATTRDWIDAHGLPRAIYVDRSGIYRDDRDPTAEELLAGQTPRTQFGQAMDELAVELILARSPQAKGRVERMNATLQDRLVKALRRAEISDLASANHFLAKTFLPSFNERFVVEAASSEDAHREVDNEVDLDRILARGEQRVVRADWTIRWHNKYLQLTRDSGVQPKQRVEVRQQLDGRLRVFADDRELTWSPTRSEPTPRRTTKSKSSDDPIRSNQGQRPAANHPWRSRVLPAAATKAPPDRSALELGLSSSPRLRSAPPTDPTPQTP